jgi:acetoin utilization deacetylase AcuC-like enzyme
MKSRSPARRITGWGCVSSRSSTRSPITVTPDGSLTSPRVARNFPLRKEPSDLDVELPDGCTDGPYLDALDGALAALWRRHGERLPGLVFYLAGADPHEGDRLGRLKISAAGLAERDRRVFAACRERGVPVAVSMAGGYGRNIDDTVAVHLRTLQEACASRRAIHHPSRARA